MFSEHCAGRLQGLWCLFVAVFKLAAVATTETSSSVLEPEDRAFPLDPRWCWPVELRTASQRLQSKCCGQCTVQRLRVRGVQDNPEAPQSCNSQEMSAALQNSSAWKWGLLLSGDQPVGAPSSHRMHNNQVGSSVPWSMSCV